MHDECPGYIIFPLIFYILCFLTSIALHLSLIISYNFLGKKIFELNQLFLHHFAYFLCGQHTSMFMFEVSSMVKYSIHNSIEWSFCHSHLLSSQINPIILVLGELWPEESHIYHNKSLDTRIPRYPKLGEKWLNNQWKQS